MTTRPQRSLSWGSAGGRQAGSSGCERHGSYGSCPGPQARRGSRAATVAPARDSDAAARQRTSLPLHAARHRRGCPSSGRHCAASAAPSTSGCPRTASRTPRRHFSTTMGPTRTTTRGRTLTQAGKRRGQGRRHLGAGAVARARKRRDAGTECGNQNLRHRRCARPCGKTSQTHAPRRRAPPRNCARRAGRAGRCSNAARFWQRPELDFGATKDELATFDNDGQLMSIKDHCAVPPPEPRKPIIEPPTDVEALRRDYDARFSGLHAYGPTGRDAA